MNAKVTVAECDPKKKNYVDVSGCSRDTVERA